MSQSRILIVDDDDDVRESLIDELCANYQVESVRSGEEALEILETRAYDAIISDLRMPGISGIQVLEHARERDPDIIRILLTGYLDEDAQKATKLPYAPFKVGKPWHDEIEVTLRRAFEFREQRRGLNACVTDALAIAGVDEELASAEGFTGMAKVLARRIKEVNGVKYCAVTLDVVNTQRTLAGDKDCDYRAALGHDILWKLDEAISDEHNAYIHVCGCGTSSEDIVRLLCERAKRWAQEDEGTRLARRASNPKARDRLTTMSRWASLGAMTTSLVHDLASVVQSLQGSIFELEYVVRDAATDDPEVLESLDTVNEMSKRMLSLFKAMRSFVRSHEMNRRPHSISDLVDKASTLCKGHFRARLTLNVYIEDDVHIEASEPLFLQVLVNILQNAVEVSPDNGTVDLEVRTRGDHIDISIIDDGPGVPEDLVDSLFDPFVTSNPEHNGSGLGLAIASQIVCDHGGDLTYKRHDSRGACFVISMPTIAS